MSDRPKRGDVVTVAAGSGFGGKPRPGLVIQSDEYQGLTTVTLALFTGTLTDTELRPRFEPSRSNGLFRSSDLMVDLVITVRRERVAEVIGSLTEGEMIQVGARLRVFFGLDQ